MSRAMTALKYTSATLLLLALLLAACALWLRHEFARVNAEAREQYDWNRVAVTALAGTVQGSVPCAEQHPNRRAWFGALHVHTATSYDATSFGSLVTPDMAYRFARGEPVSLALRGDPPDYVAPSITISSPLDFMAVTDHAESLGEVDLCYDESSTAHGALVCRMYRGDIRLPVQERLQPIMRLVTFAIFGNDRSARVCGEDGARCRQRAEAVWQANQLTTEAWQDPSADCEFTTFHGYEYSLAEQSSNLHRNVIFAGAVVPQAVISSRDARQPRELWQWLRDVCIAGNPDCDALAIPHNSNWSSGRMWQPYSNQDLTPAERLRLATLRAEIEPLAEMMQVKGDSECRNGIPSVIGAPDEQCNFEKLRSASQQIPDCGDEVGSGGMLLKGCVSRNSYVRYALTAGLAEEAALGVNPFKMGIVAATDTHNGAPAAGQEKGHLGSHGSDRDRRNRLLGQVDVPGDIARGSPVRYNPGGIAGVYAKENSRAALFEAMRRRETFGTSGPRITPRFFAGWDLPEDLCQSGDYLAQAYAGGVPMGGDLPPAPAAAAGGPLFVASAHQDARRGANLLQRIQVIKGWNDAQGRTHQAVYDIAGSADNGAS
ncbi:MAG: DUF3604 domain-containing protein, partial [Halioglobus sp.]|nr:DUF3604 domain-containing protein [Halioglobus sp.]